MGWFDDSESEEEDKKRNQSRREALLLTDFDGVASTTSSNNQEKVEQSSEDADPLDAFMKNLSPPPPASKETTKKTSARMDLEGCEEEEQIGEHIHVQSNRSEETTQSLRNNSLTRTFRKSGTVDRHSDSTRASSSQQEEPPEWRVTFQKSFWNPVGFDTAFGRNWRRENSVHLHHFHRDQSSQKHPNNEAYLDPILKFSALKGVLGPDLYSNLLNQGFSTPTIVQSQAWPLTMAGRDVMVTAATGQGKTLAYLLPALVHVVASDTQQHPTALVLVPTRELAQQVHRQAKVLLPSNFRSRAIIGGQGKYILQQELKKNPVHCVVATPGRLLDVAHSSKGLSLRHVTVVVLDEADKLLHMGFESQVQRILKQYIRPDRQTILLSATMSRRIESVAAGWLSRGAVKLAVGETGRASKHVTQHVMVFPNGQVKELFLLELLPSLVQVGRTLVFVATRDACEQLATRVRASSLSSAIALDTLHGDKHQMDRTAALTAFRRHEISLLIATDLAGRGLDVPQVATVVNFDVAKNLDTHVHRIGRAGRLSKEDTAPQQGSAYTLLTNTPKDADFAHVLKGAWEREQREVPKELLELASQSRRSGNVAYRSRFNQSGLGYDIRDASVVDAPRGSELSSMEAPPRKRSRWS